ncbi:MAG: DUF1570 domain-containing protein [Planctomycetota bacterium]|nr:MAG: DUF1570 domain-containing protein [Planctomycetota bacterium]
MEKRAKNMKRFPFIAISTIFLLFFLAPLGAPSSLYISYDYVYLREGKGRLRGKILQENQKGILLQTPYLTQHWIPRQEISKVVKALTPLEEYQKRYQELSKNPDAKGEEYWQLALFCQQYPSLKKYVLPLCQKAIEKDPNHEGARAKLGHILFEGRWVTQAELAAIRKRSIEEQKRRLAALKKKPTSQGSTSIPRKKVPSSPKVPKAVKKGIYGKFLDIFKYQKAAVPWEKAYIYRSKYYLIRSNTKKEYLKIYGKVMDLFFEIFRKVFRYRGMPRRRSEIWIYSNRKEFLDRTGKTTALGFYSLTTRRVTTYHGMWSPNTHTFTVLAHEGTHQFQHLVLGRNFLRTPIWIIEGLAVFLSTADYDGKRIRIGGIPKDRLIPLQRLIRRNKYIPIDELIRTPQRRFTGTHYAHAWGIIYWMIYTNKKNKAIFMRIWDKCRESGLNFNEFKQIIRVDIKRWEAVWKDWILKLKADG